MKTSQEKALKDRIDRLKKENQRLTERRSFLKNEKMQLIKDLKQARRILNEIPAAVILIQAGHVVISNEAAWNMLGYSEEEFFNCEFSALFHPTSSEQASLLLNKWAKDKPVPSQFEILMATRNGDPLCCDVRWKKVRHKGMSAHLLNVTCIDQRKSTERMLTQSQKINAISMMASGLSRNLSRGLKIFKDQFAEIVEMGSVDSKKMIRSMRRIESLAERGNFMSQQLNCLRKLKYEPEEMVVFDLEKVIEEAVAVSSLKSEDDGRAPVNIMTYQRAMSPVEGHPEEMRDALVCMILNAVDAMPDRGDIYLSSEENSGLVWIYIQDSGQGMTDDIKERMFDPFFTTKGGNRAGLGLSLAYAIINRHRGEIEVVTRQGQGSTFIVKLPLSRRPLVPETKMVKNMIRDARVLIVSDGGIGVDLLTQILVTRGGRVTTANTCTEGLRLQEKKNFDLLIIDVGTSDIKAAKIGSRIKKIKGTSPVILLNLSGDGKSSSLSKEFGTDFIIERPMELSKVSVLISEAIAAKDRF